LEVELVYSRRSWSEVLQEMGLIQEKMGPNTTGGGPSTAVDEPGTAADETGTAGIGPSTGQGGAI
jgi:hypothetical protein